MPSTSLSLDDEEPLRHRPVDPNFSSQPYSDSYSGRDILMFGLISPCSR
jgi:hypothetical protein